MEEFKKNNTYLATITIEKTIMFGEDTLKELRLGKVVDFNGAFKVVDGKIVMKDANFNYGKCEDGETEMLISDGREIIETKFIAFNDIENDKLKFQLIKEC